MRVIALALFLSFVLVATAAAHVTRIPHRCTTRPAQRLCAIHFHHDRTNQLRSRSQHSRLVYQWLAERYPARRSMILRLWMHRQAHADRLLTAYKRQAIAQPWVSGGWLRDALCVHHYEGAWNANTGNGYYGGMQFDLGTWTANGGTGRPDLASPAEQLRIAYRTWQSRGWSPWPNTARSCGLL